MALSIAYLTWRIGATLNPDAWWISLLLLGEVHTLGSLALFTFSLWRVNIRAPQLLPFPPMVVHPSRSLVIAITRGRLVTR